MLKIDAVHNLKLEPLEIEGVDLNVALKNFILFSEMNGEICICLHDKYISDSFSFLSKYNFSYKKIFLDEESFDKLYNKFLEVRTDRELVGINETTEEEVNEEDLSLTEFLRNTKDILTSEESAPIIKFVNSLFYQAVKRRSSDIHIEMHEFKGEVRFRIDGVLVRHVELEKNILNLVVSRIKVISNLDISEKRIPQDGRTQVKIAGKTLDIRVSVLPTYYGERVVMRILMQSEDIPHLPELGFDRDMVKTFEELLKYSHGIILVTGPTGSGKSTTLHSFLQQVSTPEKNIITVEDPVEYKADNISQIQVNSKVGLTFAAGLRSILRQDPDVVMVGEIRDGETASIAIQAALTGHLVLSTLHTNNATAAITRLADMKVEPFLISSALLGVLAQRLVRLLCPHCKEEDILAEEFSKEFDLPTDAKIYKASGCRECGYTGYMGRKAIGEIFILNDKIKTLLKETTNDHVIRQVAKDSGLVTLSDRLKEMLLDGQTSLDEAIRVGIKDS
ncbi:MAG: type II/IV secretion system protein [Campylobacterales bacterium]|nr:type II/IV secretion system protein [Campylobacterales bacterium]